MTNLNPYMRLKVKGDTFFLPDPNGGVYFRNNIGSFRMEGRTISQWIEKLMPVFNGEHTLQDLTDDLPDEYRDRVYEIAEMLYKNGFVRDVSQDRPHQLSNQILNKYASQIEFLDSFGSSGAFRFQSYRETKVLAVGSGPIFVSLVSALLESGLPKFHVLVTDTESTNRKRLSDLAEHSRRADSEVGLEEFMFRKEGAGSWREAVKKFDSILYVSQEGNIDDLCKLHLACKEENKLFLPAIIVQHVGIACTAEHADSEDCWESAWRRIHQAALTKDSEIHKFSSTAGALLANVIVFQLFKTITRVPESEQNHKFFLLNLETLEGSWHSFLPHPLVNGMPTVEYVENLDVLLNQTSEENETSGLLPFFSDITSSVSGIFHFWEEGKLKQLPLAQCSVQAADPLSNGPADLLPEIVCAALTHEEARRDAGLAGIESYVSRMAGLLVSKRSSWTDVDCRIEPQDFIGVGAGETLAESVCRGLQKCLSEKLKHRHFEDEKKVYRVQLESIEDDRCRFYLHSLTVLHGEPMICLGEEVLGFPVVWVGSGGRWYFSAGLHLTMALQNSLLKALHEAQNHAVQLSVQAIDETCMHLHDETPKTLFVSANEELGHLEVLQSSLQVLKRNRVRLMVFDLTVEPFLKERLAGAFGVLLREEETR